MEAFLYILAGIIAGYFLARLIGLGKDDIVGSSSRVTTLPTPEAGRFGSPFLPPRIHPVAGTSVTDLSGIDEELLCALFRRELRCLSGEVWLVAGNITDTGMRFGCAKSDDSYGGYGAVTFSEPFKTVPTRSAMARDVAHGKTNR